MDIRKYRNYDEKKWLLARHWSFLDSSYFDDVLKSKENYSNPSISLVAEVDGEIVGFIDVEYEKNIGDVCYNIDTLGAVIWHLGVVPEHRGKGIASKLLYKVISILKDNNISHIEAWTQNDELSMAWYMKNNFKIEHSYVNAFIDSNYSEFFNEKFINDIYGTRTINIELPIEKKQEYSKYCSRIHEVLLFRREI